MTTIGDRIRRERKKQGFSQDRLSKGICSQSSLSRLENNNVHLSVMTMNQILEKLNLSFNDLLENEETIKENLFTNELDAARDQRDYDGMERILNNYLDTPQASGRKFKMYTKWHQGLISFYNRDFKNSEAQLKYAIHLADKHRLNNYIPHLYMAMGNTKYFLGERPLKYYAEADKIYRELKIVDFRLEMKILYNLIVSYSKEGQHHQVILKCKKAIKILNLNFSTYLMCDIYNLWMKALLRLNEKESYRELRSRTYIIFENHNCLEMWEKLESYSAVNN